MSNKQIMKSIFTERFWVNYEKYFSDFQEIILDKVEEWETEPFRPVLDYIKISPVNDIWSIKIINRKVRLFGIKDGNTMTWFFIGSHEEFIDFIPVLN